MDNSNSQSGQRLAELTRVVREVDSAPDLESALSVLVRRTREVMEVDVSTVYFTDESSRRHVIAATDGLSSSVVGKVQCDFGEGLVGKVAASRRSLNLEHIPPELDQDFLLQAGTERYQGFLGVPVFHKRRVQGVLLVRQHEARRFDDADEAMLTTLAAQLGGAIAHAKASGEWCRVCHPRVAVPSRIDSMAGAPGLAVGVGVAVFGTNQIGAYELLLDSPEILEAALAEIRQGNWAPGSVSRAVESHAARFDAMSDPYLRERAADIRALGGRIVTRVLGGAMHWRLGRRPQCLSVSA